MRNKYVAAILAIFLGSFGVHKFYLGENLAGVLYLIFFWAYIPGLLAFFDFLGLLLTSEEDFDAKYNKKYLGSTTVINRGSFTENETRIQRESSQEKLASLMELKKIYDAGIITAEEFEEKRRKILDSI